jgi:methylenetetrahydrofolate dehydrogenase (NADP+)/methenyltetrahydrofolate cyclohydrolase
MAAQLIDGRKIADEVLTHIRNQTNQRLTERKRTPGLAVILVGQDPASTVYVRNKRRACAQAGIISLDYDLPAETNQTYLIDLIDQLNADPTIDGILLQLPLPEHIDAATLVQRIHPHKDVDGFHADNVGRLALGLPGLRPCTSKAVMTLLAHTGAYLKGYHAVIVGASNHVGRPTALELLLADCTVTCCHRYTENLPSFVASADLLVVAVGNPGIIPGEWIKPGAIVIDVGINRTTDGKLVGDIEPISAQQRASWITPVPGGVGPVTVAMLMQNTLEAAQRSD